MTGCGWTVGAGIRSVVGRDRLPWAQTQGQIPGREYAATVLIPPSLIPSLLGRETDNAWVEPQDA
jgi:hypothetical protein